MDILSLVRRFQVVSHVDRCSNTPHIKPYPVSRHSFFVSLFGLLFADLENDYYGYEKIDASLVAKKALVHDLEESFTGDILYPVRESSEDLKEKLNQMREYIVDHELFKELPVKVRSWYISLWKTAKDDSEEGKLVAAMDKFEILIFSLDELDMGNISFRVMYSNALEILRKEFDDIKTLMQVLDDIEKQYGHYTLSGKII